MAFTSRLVPRVAAAILLAGLGLAPACVPARDHALSRLHYRLEVRPGEPFRVELRAEGLSRRASFRMLDGWGMLQGMPAHVRDLRAVDAHGREIPVAVDRGDGETRWHVKGLSRGEVTLRYTVDPYDPVVSPEASFAHRDRFVLLGYSLFLLPRRVNFFDPLDIRVQVVTAARDTWSSWPPTGEVFAPSSPHDLWSGVVAGGSFEEVPLSAGTVSVTVLAEGRNQRSTGVAIANRLLPVLREMQDFFGGSPRSDSLHVLAIYRLLPESREVSMMTGTSEEGAFLCLATPDRFHAVDPLTVLAAHECLHFYLGGAITALPEPPYRNTPELAWFVEGLTEYLAYDLMEEAGVLSPADVTRTAALKYRDYRRTPGWETQSVADAARRMEDLETYRLVYTRGYLAARLIDREMTERGGPEAMRHALRDLFRRHNTYHGGTPITSEEVSRVLDAHAPGVSRIIDLYAVGNAPIPDPQEDGVAGDLSARRP